MREASSSVKASATFPAIDELQEYQAKWHNMAVSDMRIAQTPHAELVRVVSHVRHLLSKELLLCVLKTLLLRFLVCSEESCTHNSTVLSISDTLAICQEE